MPEPTFTVEEIHCAGGERTIRAGLSGLTGVRDVGPDRRRHTVAIRYDDASVTVKEMAARLDEFGYPAVGAG